MAQRAPKNKPGRSQKGASKTRPGTPSKKGAAGARKPARQGAPGKRTARPGTPRKRGAAGAPPRKTARPGTPQKKSAAAGRPKSSGGRTARTRPGASRKDAGPAPRARAAEKAPNRTCKGVCKKYRVNRPPSGARYESGQCRCQICDIWMDHRGARLKDGSPAVPDTVGWTCRCCNYRLRQKPRSRIYKGELKRVGE